MVNTAATFQIQERDQYGNARDTPTYDEDGVTVDVFRIYFEPQNVTSEGSAARLPWLETYSKEGGSGLHEVSYLPGLAPENAETLYPPPLAATYLLYISDVDPVTGEEVETEGSPWTVEVRPDVLSVEHCEVLGPGAIYNNLNPGTVRAGLSTTITITAKDQYGNRLTAGGESTWLVVLKTFPPLFEGQTSTGEVEDHGNGTYTGRFTPIMSGELLLQVRRGTPVPVEGFRYYNASSSETLARPGEDPYTGVGGGRYISSDMINDFTRPEGYEEDVDFVGVLVNILPGPVSPYFTQVRKKCNERLG